MQITEFLFNAEGADSGKEWIEVYNAGNVPVDMSTWRIKMNSAHALTPPPKNGGIGTTTLAPGAYAILADNAAAFVQDYPGVANVIDTSVSLPNSKGAIALLDGSRIVDAVSYINDDKQAAGLSLQKIGNEWKLGAPTPGAANRIETLSPVTAQEAYVPASARPTASKTIAKKMPTRASASHAAAHAGTARASKSVAATPNDAEVVGDDMSPDAPPEDTSTSSVQLAAAAPVVSASIAPWLLALLGLVGVAIVGHVYFRRVKEGEWDIVDETPQDA